MSYSFDRSDRGVEPGLRRIALGQIDRALEESLDDDLPMAERVHRVRKRCKKLRGLIRIVRPVFPDYDAENAAFRDAARRLSDIRDAAALVETCDALTERFSDRLSRDAFAPFRDALARDARDREAGHDVEDRLDRSREDLRAARERSAGWVLETEGPEAVAMGARKTFARARKAMEAAREEPGATRMHDWRKRVKYHWYHMRLLKKASPILAAQADVADDLAESLGQHHDTHVLEAALENRADEIAEDGAEALRGLLIARRDTLEARCFEAGARLFSERPKGLSRRISGYWCAWQDDAA